MHHSFVTFYWCKIHYIIPYSGEKKELTGKHRASGLKLEILRLKLFGLDICWWVFVLQSIKKILLHGIDLKKLLIFCRKDFHTSSDRLGSRCRIYSVDKQWLSVREIQPLLFVLANVTRNLQIPRWWALNWAANYTAVMISTLPLRWPQCRSGSCPAVPKDQFHFGSSMWSDDLLETICWDAQDPVLCRTESVHSLILFKLVKGALSLLVLYWLQHIVG